MHSLLRINKFVLASALWIGFFTSSEVHADIKEFLMLSQKRDALRKEDCIKHGGTLSGINIKKFESGQQSPKYNNLIKFEDSFYIVFSYRKKSWRDIFGPEYALQSCRFRF